MKTILCYGDSNTYGANPAGPRYDHNTRWPGAMRNALGEGWWVVEEGCGGRTTVWEDPIERDKDGSAYLPPCLNSHCPIDLVIIILGTNDLKQRFGLGAEDIARGAGVLVDICRKSGTGPNAEAPKVLLVAPPPLQKLAGTPLAEMFAGAEEKSRRFAQCYERIANEMACGFFDASLVIVSSKVDAIHWDASQHIKLGHALAARVKEILR